MAEKSEVLRHPDIAPAEEYISLAETTAEPELPPVGQAPLGIHGATRIAHPQLASNSAQQQLQLLSKWVQPHRHQIQAKLLGHQHAYT